MVNQTFSKFDDPYFKGIGDATREHYRPQVSEQFGGARRNLTFKFANNPNSSAANRTFADLFRDKIRADQGVEMDALGREQGAREEVERNRAQQLNLLESGASLENVASQSAAAADREIGRSNFSPLGDLFSKYTANLANNEVLRNQGYPGASPYNKTADFLRGGSKGSSRVVGG